MPINIKKTVVKVWSILKKQNYTKLSMWKEYNLFKLINKQYNINNITIDSALNAD